MPNIFDLDNEINQVAEAFDRMEEAGEAVDLLGTIEAYFGELMDQRDAKLDNYARWMDQETAIADARQIEADRLKDLATAGFNRVKRAKETLLRWMDSRGMTKVETPLHKFGIQANGGFAPVDLAPEYRACPDQLPEEFRVVRYDPNTVAIRTALEEGRELPFARLGDRGRHLRIR